MRLINSGQPPVQDEAMGNFLLFWTKKIPDNFSTSPMVIYSMQRTRLGIIFLKTGFIKL